MAILISLQYCFYQAIKTFPLKTFLLFIFYFEYSTYTYKMLFCVGVERSTNKFKLGTSRRFFTITQVALVLY